MADIICIASGIYRDGINNIGDIVDVLDDGKADGEAFGSFSIIHVDGMTAKEVKAGLETKIPEQSMCFKLGADKDTWTFDKPEEKQVWKDPVDSEWKDLKISPKYILSTTSFTKDDITTLSDKTLKVADKKTVLQKATDNISKDSNNSTVISISTVAVSK